MTRTTKSRSKPFVVVAQRNRRHGRRRWLSKSVSAVASGVPRFQIFTVRA